MCPDPHPDSEWPPWYTVGICLVGRPEGSSSLATFGFHPKLAYRKDESPKAGPLSPWFLSVPGFSSHTSCPTVPHPHYGLYWTALSMPQVSPPRPSCFPSPCLAPAVTGTRMTQGSAWSRNHHLPKWHSVANPLPSPRVVWTRAPEAERERPTWGRSRSPCPLSQPH